MNFTVSYLPEIAFIFMLIFGRLGTMIMIMPALGETSVPTRMRLVMALAITLVFYPVVVSFYPAGLSDNIYRVLAMLGAEIVIGAFIGLATRLITSVLQIAGTIIANQSGLAFAMAFDPSQGVQGALFGNFLSVVGITLIFVTDMHFLAIAAMHDSFELFPPGNWVPIGDAAELIMNTVAGVFSIGMRMAAPFIVFGLIFYFGLGLLNRLMPQMQIFFIAMPANIIIGLLMLMILLSTLMTWYLGHVEDAFGQFLVR
ncbi:MAG: flagellar biosynthetic protein FliR [Stappiaceae bacterium]